MILIITGLVLLLAVAVTFADWRRGLLVAVPVAILQDPLRKLMPGEPVAYVLLVGVVIGVAALAAMMSGTSLAPSRILGWRRYLAKPFGFFMVILILQALNAYEHFGMLIIPAIGCLAYVTPFVALGVVYQTLLRSSENYLTRFLQFYVLCVSLTLTTIYLQYIGYDWPILGEVGNGLVIYDMGTGLRAYSGLFRSSEVAAWHAATVVCFIAILTMVRGASPGRALLGGLLVLLVIALGMMTGRRKFLIEIVVFASAYVTLLLYFGRGAARLAFTSGFIGLIGSLALTLIIPDDTKDVLGRSIPYDFYVERTKSAFGAVPERFTTMGIAPVSWAYNRYGIVGAGLGAGSQGTQYFGAAEQGAAEGGLGKIWLELGAPGLVVICWLGLAFTRHLWNILKRVSRQSITLSRTACGLMSYLTANVATFSVATQVYGDIFVLVMLGTALAGLMVIPVFAEQALQQRVLDKGLDPSFVLATRPTKAAALR